jgi:DNA-binding HxlR family transcriptional regulator
MEVALELIGTRSAMTLLREAFHGASRFDDLVARAGLSSMTGSVRLKEFVSAGLMFKRPYQSAYGTRCEYVLTDLGNQCFPVVEALMRFGAAVDDASNQAGLCAAAETSGRR